MTSEMTTERADPSVTEPAVRVSGLGKSYWSLRGGRTVALQGFDAAVPKGSVAALIGANGAGKTTLLTILAGLRVPDEGRVHSVGRTAFVSQDKAVYRQLKPLEMVRLAARLNRVFDTARAHDWLRRFEVPLGRTCGRLSGGQQAQVAFAIAVGSCPDVLLLDEPLSNLDPLVRREVMAEFLDRAAETGMTIVLSTHVIAELGGVADYLLLLSRGRLIVGGELDDLLAAHVRYAGPPADTPPGPGEVIEARHHARQSSFLVRLSGNSATPEVAAPWTVAPVTLEDYVLAQLAATRRGGAREGTRP